MKDKAVHFGGCAGNIAFSAKLLHEDVVMLGIAGRDFSDYEKWLRANKISTDSVIIDESVYTSQATVATDQKGRQIILFHEGAAALSPKYTSKIRATILKHKNQLRLAIVAPNNRNFMLTSIKTCLESKIPYIFDPGQAMPLFSKSELRDLAQKSAGMMLNEYELELYKKLAQISLKEIIQNVPLLVITLGEKGSEIYFEEKVVRIPAIKSKSVKDPTGCGDAYRAGFIVGIQNDMKNLNIKILQKAAALGTKLAAACLQKVGTQNHTASLSLRT